MRTTTRHGVPLLDVAQRARMRPELLDVIEYRKSGWAVLPYCAGMASRALPAERMWEAPLQESLKRGRNC